MSEAEKEKTVEKSGWTHTRQALERFADSLGMENK